MASKDDLIIFLEELKRSSKAVIKETFNENIDPILNQIIFGLFLSKDAIFADLNGSLKEIIIGFIRLVLDTIRVLQYEMDFAAPLKNRIKPVIRDFVRTLADVLIVNLFNSDVSKHRRFYLLKEFVKDILMDLVVDLLIFDLKIDPNFPFYLIEKIKNAFINLFKNLITLSINAILNYLLNAVRSRRTRKEGVCGVGGDAGGGGGGGGGVKEVEGGQQVAINEGEGGEAGDGGEGGEDGGGNDDDDRDSAYHSDGDADDEAEDETNDKVLYHLFSAVYYGLKGLKYLVILYTY
uniref:Uncharacterized protein n=1 Tax=Meloidogyne incognita TaxID=6306 RepID=A0A914MLB9_MELIC